MDSEKPVGYLRVSVTAGGLAYPVVIENGEVTSINIEWR